MIEQHLQAEHKLRNGLIRFNYEMEKLNPNNRFSSCFNEGIPIEDGHKKIHDRPTSSRIEELGGLGSIRNIFLKHVVELVSKSNPREVG